MLRTAKEWQDELLRRGSRGEDTWDILKDFNELSALVDDVVLQFHEYTRLNNVTVFGLSNAISKLRPWYRR
jgi:hypothetical protein